MAPKRHPTRPACYTLGLTVLWCIAVGMVFFELLELMGWRTALVANELEKRVHVGLARADIEHYLGRPNQTVEALDRLPGEERLILPDRHITGSMSTYGAVKQPRYRGIPFTGFVWLVGVYVYYDERDIAEYVHVWNFS